MKNLKKVLFVVVFILIAFVSGMFFANKPVFRGLHHECLEAILRKS